MPATRARVWVLHVDRQRIVWVNALTGHVLRGGDMVWREIVAHCPGCPQVVECAHGKFTIQEIRRRSSFWPSGSPVRERHRAGLVGPEPVDGLPCVLAELVEFG